jgi:hypothetical protein
MKRALASSCALAVVVLAARVLAYALAPQSLLAARFEHSVGGPSLLAVALGSLGLAAGLAAAVLGLAVLAVRERLALERLPVLAPPRVHPLRFGVRFAALFVAASGGFALLESYVHWRAGLGWHGLHCLVGPVHRDAIPLLAALSLVAVAVAEAVEHVVAWTRRALVRLRPLAHPVRAPVPPAARDVAACLPCYGVPLPPRGPPGRVLLVRT